MDIETCRECARKTGLNMVSCPSRTLDRCFFNTIIKDLESENIKLRSETGKLAADLRISEAEAKASWKTAGELDRKMLRFLEVALEAQASAIEAKDEQILLLKGNLFRLQVGKEVFEGISKVEVTPEIFEFQREFGVSGDDVSVVEEDSDV